VIAAPDAGSPVVPCPRCGQGLRAEVVKTAIWRGDRLFVVEDIPAQVCGSCMEQFYDEATTEALRRLTGEGFASATATRELLVPIFSLEGHILRGTPSSEDVETDY
jgi:YgiT-type zinc finger domain-containing protein